MSVKASICSTRPTLVWARWYAGGGTGDVSPHGVGTIGLISWAREQDSSRGQSTTSSQLGNALQRTKRFVLPREVSEYQSPGRQDPKQLVEYTLPVQGDVRLLELSPSSRQMLGFNGSVEVYDRTNGSDTAIAFYVEDFGEANNAVIQRTTAILDNLRVNAEQLTRDLESYNPSVRGEAQSAIASEKQRREQKRKRDDDLLNALP